MTDDPFRHFAADYDWGFPGHGESAQFLRRIFESHGVRTALDCACGTGRDLILLAQMGFRMCGSDISPAMLRQARLNLRAHGLSVPLHRVDFRALHSSFNRRWDAVICLSTSLPQLPNRREVLRALRSMRAVIEPGGILILSQGMSDKLYRLQSRRVRVYDDESGTRDMLIDYGKRCWKVRVVDTRKKPGGPATSAYEFRYLRLLLEDHLRLLGQAGFTAVEAFDGFSGRRYSKRESASLLLACSNPE